jgi:hypothetical protein
LTLHLISFSLIKGGSMSNITLSVDDQVVRKVRKIAVDRNTTLTELVRGYLTRLAEEDSIQRQLAAEDLEQTFRTLSREMGPRNWRRDDLHDR